MNTATFRTNLKTLFDARSGVTTISGKMEKYPPGKLGTPNPTLFIGTINLVQEDLTLLPSSDLNRTYTVSGGGWGGGAGATDTIFAAAEAKAQTLMSELEATCLADQTINGACIQARLTTYELGVVVEPDNVYFGVDWTITVRDVS